MASKIERFSCTISLFKFGRTIEINRVDRQHAFKYKSNFLNIRAQILSRNNSQMPKSGLALPYYEMGKLLLLNYDCTSTRTNTDK